MVNEKELKELNDIDYYRHDLDYYRHEALHDYPGEIMFDELQDVIAGMDEDEKTLMQLALAELDEETIGRVIINAIQRQYAEQIETLAEEYLAAYLEGLKEDAEDAKDEVRCL